MHEALTQAEQEAGSASFKAKESAQLALRNIKTFPETKGSLLAGMSGKERQALKKEQEKTEKGLGQGDVVFRRLQGMGRESGERANAIANILNDTHTTLRSRKELFDDLDKRELLPAEIVLQLMRQFKNGYIKGPRPRIPVSNPMEALPGLYAQPDRRDDYWAIIKEISPTGSLGPVLEKHGLTANEFVQRAEAAKKADGYKWIEATPAFEPLLSEMEARLKRLSPTELRGITPEDTEDILSEWWEDDKPMRAAIVGALRGRDKDFDKYGLQPLDLVRVALRRARGKILYREAAD